MIQLTLSSLKYSATGLKPTIGIRVLECSLNGYRSLLGKSSMPMPKASCLRGLSDSFNCIRQSYADKGGLNSGSQLMLVSEKSCVSKSLKASLANALMRFKMIGVGAFRVQILASLSYGVQMKSGGSVSRDVPKVFSISTISSPKTYITFFH